MPSPKISTFREITPLIYSWSTPDIPKYDGWEKIGFTEQDSADTRIAQQASQLSVEKQKVWSRRALFTSEAGGSFTDREFHAYLKQLGIKRELKPNRTEWHEFKGAPKSSLDYFNSFAGQDFEDLQRGGTDDYTLRPEQQDAVRHALEAFAAGHDEVLWNAKPRFGKTLTSYDLMRGLGARKVLIVTNRPAIAASWFDDFERFIGHQTTYKFVSGTPFKALASGKFSEAQIFNWTYLDEQVARRDWSDKAAENPYTALPTLNMLTYQVSRMITDQLALGVAAAEDDANIDYAFNLGEFFSTKDTGFFVHEAEVIKFLDCLATNEKYPFSTPELRDEIRHSFWLLDRVASAKALQRLLMTHDVFKDYTVVLAAGDGRGDDADTAIVGKSLDQVHTAIGMAERTNGKTITLSVGQLTTGVTVPEWTAVIMLSNITSPALYMQAAFRAQNPRTFERGGRVLQKENAYIFDFAPERTLTVLDTFANNLNSTPSGDLGVRQEHIRELLNFFPVIGEDSEGRMVELDAAQVLTFPKVFKAREVVRRGFLSNLLFNNVAGIFRYSEHVKDILEKLPEVKQGKSRAGQTIEFPEPAPVVDAQGSVQIDTETVINPKVAELGAPVWRVEDIAPIERDGSHQDTARQIAKLVTEKARETREKLKLEYGLSARQVERDERQTEARVIADVERTLTERDIADRQFADALEEAATEVDAQAIQAQRVEHRESFNTSILALVNARTDEIATEVVTREETKSEQNRANQTMDDARSHLRGFARTIPMFLMAYGDRDIRLANFDDYTPDHVFEEITGITEQDFRVLRDGQDIIEEDGTVIHIPGMFDAAVFDQSVQEFLTRKEQLADYFDESQTEDIFAYIPHQKTSLVFTPRAVVETMIDALEAANPGIFEDHSKTFADLFSTAGLFLMEIVRRLDSGLTDTIPDQEARLRHILTKQIFEMSHNELLHRITIEAVSGGVPERKIWIESSGHFKVGNLARMSTEERQQMIYDMLTEGN
jgi:type II restriction enzyme